MIKFDFSDRLVLVTGASKGIGKAISEELLNANAYVLGTFSIDRIAAEKCKDDLLSISSNFELIKSDIAKRSDVQKLFNIAFRRFGRPVDMIVNNAGFLAQGDFLELGDEQWDHTFNVNLKGPFMLCQEFMKLKKAELNGPLSAIVNISSIGGQVGGNKAPDYAATKAALISLTRSVARLGSNLGIRSNAVAPGWIETEIFSQDQLLNLQQEAKNVIPLSRLGLPIEVAYPVLFLLSDASSYINGHCININGGMYFG